MGDIPALNDFIDQHGHDGFSLANFNIEDAGNNIFSITPAHDKRSYFAFDAFKNFIEANYDSDKATAVARVGEEPNYGKTFHLGQWNFTVDDDEIQASKDILADEDFSIDNNDFGDPFVNDVEASYREGIITREEADLILFEELN